MIRLRCHSQSIPMSDLFRDFGILPDGQSRPSAKVRAYLSTSQIGFQFFACSTIVAIPLAIGICFFACYEFPWNCAAALAFVAMAGLAINFLTKNAYYWVEVDGDIIRAKNLYTRCVIERRLSDVEELFTLVIRASSRTTAAVNTVIGSWFGRIKGVRLKFRDGLTPIAIMRTDPAMLNARELIEAIISRMSEIGDLDYDVEMLDGKPLVSRIFWKQATT
jgi:hypothetical protein